jgi:hypothetical protein
MPVCKDVDSNDDEDSGKEEGGGGVEGKTFWMS